MKPLSSALAPLLAGLLLMSMASMLAAGDSIGTATLELANTATGRKVTTELWFKGRRGCQDRVVLPTSAASFDPDCAQCGPRACLAQAPPDRDLAWQLGHEIFAGLARP